MCENIGPFKTKRESFLKEIDFNKDRHNSTKKTPRYHIKLICTKGTEKLL